MPNPLLVCAGAKYADKLFLNIFQFPPPPLYAVNLCNEYSTNDIDDWIVGNYIAVSEDEFCELYILLPFSFENDFPAT